ncbi:MAG: hypothetical protein AAF409_19780 [Pseudomonadota bacterium]
MSAGAQSSRYLVVFIHIEKCGGTSLLASSRRRAGLRHCDIISSADLGNVATPRDFRRSLSLYRNCDFITGHCLHPAEIAGYREAAEKGGREPVFITSIRDPITRLLSDYAHARRRGETMGLQEFAAIPFKQNYICNFWGDGDSDTALARLSGIDHVIRVQDFEAFVPFANRRYELGLLDAVLSNQSEVEHFPDDLKITDGFRIGKYLIDPDVHASILQANARDQDLLGRLPYWTADASSAADEGSEVDVTKTKPIYSWLYRNFWYKPLMQRRLGEVYERRNSIPHPPDAGLDYMW